MAGFSRVINPSSSISYAHAKLFFNLCGIDYMVGPGVEYGSAGHRRSAIAASSLPMLLEALEVMNKYCCICWQKSQDVTFGVSILLGR